ncbi:zona pellucida glycoprotein d [Chanos chanos]|uniref:Zona pellucida glycoprotein d n=1 Tax=Chanos chanos TaxID=29144 RepID=A0A6J2WNV5_CHACN|nr:uromodulin-like [Chanos chanos]
MTVMCGKDYISIVVIEDFFKYYKVPLESLHLTNKTCRAGREVIDGIAYYIVRTPKDQYIPCGGKPLENNMTHLSYSLTLMSDPQVHENIVREPVIKIEYKCVYPYIRRISLPFPIIPFSSETVLRVDELEAKVEMNLFKDHTYTEAFTSAPTIHLRDKVYVQVRVTEPEDFFHLRVNECWATQTPKPNETTSMHTLLQNGCVDDETVAFLNSSADDTGRNGVGSTVQYTFDMFRFVVEPHELYLHCTVRLCPPDDGGPCIPECKTITKREAVKGDPTQGLLSYGPIRIEVPESQKSNLLIVLVLPVGVIWVLGVFLLILITVAKAGSRRLSRLSRT